MPTVDQSFRLTVASFTNELVRCEGNVAGFVNDTMAERGQVRTLRGDVGADQASGFPHGQVDVGKQAFQAAGNQALSVEDQLALDYPTRLAGPGEVAIIEASAPLVLARDAKPGEIEGIYRVPSDRHLLVFGDVVTIRGRIEVPGKHVVIFARELRTLADLSGQKALIDTSARDRTVSESRSALPAAASGRKRGDARAISGWQRMDDGRIFKNPSYNREGSRTEAISDVFPEAGERAHDGRDGVMDDAAAANAAGDAGGDVFIVADSIGSDSELTVRCSGGKGGRGLQGEDGGNGGDGGNGVDEHFIANDAWGGVDYYFNQAIEGAPGGRGGDGGIGGPGGRGGASGNCTIVVNRALDGTAKIACTSEPGTFGPRGFHGQKGVNGVKGLYGNGRRAQGIAYPQDSAPRTGQERYDSLVSAKTLPAKLADPAPARWGRFAVIHDVNAGADGVPLKGLRGLARVSFLQMLLEGARACYLRWDAYRFAGDQKAEEYRAEVQARLDFLLLASSLLPLALSATDKRVKEGIHTTASDLLHNLGKGWDYFGNAENYVPIGSPKTYLPPFQKAVGLLELREKTYLDLLQSLDDRKLLSQRRDAAVSSATDALANKQELIGKLQARLIQITKELTPEGGSESEVRTKRRALVEALDGLENWLRECSGLTIQDYADCIFNLAFVNSEFTGLTTLASQAIKLADKAKNTLPNDDGQAINRKHMLLRVDTFSKRLSRLDEAWEVIGAVTRSADPQLVALKDEDAYRLLVERTEFNTLLEQFYAKEEARKAMGAMDEYVEAVQQRNAVLAEYNTLVSEYLSVAGDFRTTSAQKEEVENLQADAAAPGLLAATAFASALYNRMRETCIRSAYDACRALRFWTLKPDRTLYETFKLGTPGAIDHQFLSGVVQNLEFDKMFGKITDDLEHWVSRTPTKQEDYTGTGVCVMLKQDQYPHEFKQLRESGVARFSVPLPRIGYERFRLRLHQPLPGRAKTVTASELREALRGAKILLIRSKVGSRTDESIRIAGDKDTPVQIEVHVTERTGEPDLLIVRAVKEGITSAYCTVRDEGAGTSPKSGRIASLRQRHRSLFAQPRPKPGDAREQIIDDVAAIAGKIDARHQSLVIVSSHGWDLFDTPPSPQFVIRVFDERGKLAAEATEADLRKRRDAAKVDAFKERLRPFWKRPSLTWEEEQRIIEDVAGVLDQKALWEPKTKTNAFDGHAEVRVTKVRAWVFGVTSDDMKCHVDLKHMGNEVFRRADGAVIGLAHGPIDGIRFSYNWSNVLWNVPGGYVEKPEVSLKHDGIDADLLLQGKYASADNIPLIGPFAEWEIRIESGKHKNLDRTTITSICLDFHVLSKAITTGPLPPTPVR